LVLSGLPRTPAQLSSGWVGEKGQTSQKDFVKAGAFDFIVLLGLVLACAEDS
jgi:hypothetical protein